jgi:hypothetical protein
MREIFIDLYDGYTRWIYSGPSLKTSGSDPCPAHPSLDEFDRVTDTLRVIFEEDGYYPDEFCVHIEDHT